MKIFNTYQLYIATNDSKIYRYLIIFYYLSPSTMSVVQHDDFDSSDLVFIRKVMDISDSNDETITPNIKVLIELCKGIHENNISRYLKEFKSLRSNDKFDEYTIKSQGMLDSLKSYVASLTLKTKCAKCKSHIVDTRTYLSKEESCTLIDYFTYWNDICMSQIRYYESIVDISMFGLNENIENKDKYDLIMLEVDNMKKLFKSLLYKYRGLLKLHTSVESEIVELKLAKKENKQKIHELNEMKYSLINKNKDIITASQIRDINSKATMAESRALIKRNNNDNDVIIKENEKLIKYNNYLINDNRIVIDNNKNTTKENNCIKLNIAKRDRIILSILNKLYSHFTMVNIFNRWVKLTEGKVVMCKENTHSYDITMKRSYSDSDVYVCNDEFDIEPLLLFRTSSI